MIVASDPSKGPLVVRLNGLENIVIFSLKSHRSDPEVVRVRQRSVHVVDISLLRRRPGPQRVRAAPAAVPYHAGRQRRAPWDVSGSIFLLTRARRLHAGGLHGTPRPHPHGRADCRVPGRPRRPSRLLMRRRSTENDQPYASGAGCRARAGVTAPSVLHGAVSLPLQLAALLCPAIRGLLAQRSWLIVQSLRPCPVCVIVSLPSRSSSQRR